MSRKPDTFTKVVRFVCGLLFGFVVALLMTLQLIGMDMQTCLIIAGIAAMTCGILAMLGGDEFWETTLSWLRWW